MQYTLPIFQILREAICGGTLLLMALAWFVIAILLCVWVYRDAEKRGMGGAMWLIIVLLFGIFGLIIYLIVRKPEQKPEEKKTP